MNWYVEHLLDNFVIGMTNDNPATTGVVYKSSYMQSVVSLLVTCLCGQFSVQSKNPRTQSVLSTVVECLGQTVRPSSAHRRTTDFVSSFFKVLLQRQPTFASMNSTYLPEVSSNQPDSHPFIPGADSNGFRMFDRVRENGHTSQIINFVVHFN